MATLLYFHLKPGGKLLFFHVFRANKAQTGPGARDTHHGGRCGKNLFFLVSMQSLSDKMILLLICRHNYLSKL